MNEQLAIDWAYLATLEDGIGRSEGTGIRARWDFGCYLRDHVPRGFGGRGKVGPLQAIASELNVTEQELRYRRAFAEKFPTVDKLALILTSLGSWHAIVTEALPDRPEKPADTETPPLPEGKYRTIVLDPPWPVQKIQREERPNQAEWLDYPTMTLEAIAALPIGKLAEPTGAHIYLWTTHKFLPDSLAMIDRWGARYQCVMTWVKNVGMTPFSWMYSTEHVLFARIGSLDLLRQGLRLDFNAPVVGHSVKPDVFYERVLEASPGPLLEMFARRPREGFDVWGNEVSDAA